jgi:hypothetical protein
LLNLLNVCLFLFFLPLGYSKPLKISSEAKVFGINSKSASNNAKKKKKSRSSEKPSSNVKNCKKKKN